MLWLAALPIIAISVAAFMRRFPRHLENMNRPWIIADPADKPKIEF